MRYLKLTFLLVPLTLLFGCFYKSSLYPSPGRNTIELFGDGRFEIFSGEFENVSYYCLYDRKEDDGQVEGNIINYIEIAPYVYTVGTVGSGSFEEDSNSDSIYYTKVNYETGDIDQGTDLSLFSEEDASIFNDLIDSESPFKKK